MSAGIDAANQRLIGQNASSARFGPQLKVPVRSPRQGGQYLCPIWHFLIALSRRTRDDPHDLAGKSPPFSIFYLIEPDPINYVETKAIKNAVIGREFEIIKALGIHWSDRSKHICCPYPRHDDANPSWRWNKRIARAHCSCERSLSIFDVVSKVNGETFEQAKLWIATRLGRSDLIRTTNGKQARTTIPQSDAVQLYEEHQARALQRAREEAESREQERNHQSALRLWHEAGPFAGTPVGHHFQLRGITELPLRLDESIRFHPSCPFGPRNISPCMIALMVNVLTNEPRAIHRTALTRQGEKIGRLTFGPTKGAVIKLSPDDEVSMGLLIAEGVETALAASQLLSFRPVWACGNDGNLASFPVLADVECLTIAVDNDEGGAGQRAAAECTDRWSAAGVEVHEHLPDDEAMILMT
jgi:Toprim domain